MEIDMTTLRLLERERDLSLDVLVEAIESALLSAYHRTPDAYPKAQNGQAIATIAVANLLVTTDHADTGLVQRLTRAVIDSRDAIGKEVHAAQLVDLRTAVFTDPLPLHTGAERYYRSVKP